MLNHFLTYTIEDLPTFLTLIPLLVLWYRLDYKKKVERYFFIYLCSKLCIELVMFYMASRSMNNLFLYNTWVLVSYCLLARMCYQAIGHHVSRKVIIAGSGMFLLTFVYDIWDTGMLEVVKISGTVQCFLLIMYCLMFFFWLSQTRHIPNLLQYPVFWIFSGVLSYYAATTFATPIYNLCERVGGSQNDLYVIVLASYVMESIYLTVVGLGLLLEK
jgi:hypothetical protein